MKTKYLKGFILGGFLFTALFSLAACNSNESKSGFETSSNECLAYSTATALTMIDTEEASAEESELPADTTTGSENETPVESDTDYLPEIIEQADLIITNDSNFSFISIESDRDDYQNLNIVSFNDYENTTHTFKLYYNEVDENVETSSDEVETKISYSGIVVYNDLEYTFTFESKTEEEEDELEVKIKLVIYTDENSYISIKNESETEEDEVEEKFTYKVVEDGKEVISYSISTETEGSKTKVKVKINGETIEIEEKIKDNKHVLKIKDNKYEAFFERGQDKFGNDKHHLIENNDANNNISFEDVKNHFKEQFKSNKDKDAEKETEETE